MLQHNRKAAIENGRPEKKSRKCNNSYLDVGFTRKEKNLSVLFAGKFWPVKACYQISFKHHFTSSFHHIRSL